MPAQRIYIEYPVDAPFQDFHCPACGAAILKANAAGDEPACAHVDFLFIEELGEFEFVRPDWRLVMRERGISEVGLDPADAEDFIDRLAELKDGTTAAFFHVTTLGMSCCRSVAVTVVVAVDMYRPAAG